MDEKEKRAFWARVQLTKYGTATLGERGWRLLCGYGKLMTGPPHGGLYVSGVPCRVARDIVDALARGETVNVHLMHRHLSGNHEASALCLRNGQVVMLFDDREELA